MFARNYVLGYSNKLNVNRNWTEYIFRKIGQKISSARYLNILRSKYIRILNIIIYYTEFNNRSLVCVYC